VAPVLGAFLLAGVAGFQAAVPAAESSRTPELRFAAGTFRPLGASSAPPFWHRERAREAGETSPSGRRYLIAVARASLDAAQRDRLRAAGAEILDYVHAGGYRVRTTPPSEAAVRALPFVVWLDEAPAWVKVQPRLTARAGRPEGSVKIRAVLNAGEPADRALAALAGTDARAHASGKDGAVRVEAEVPAGRLERLLPEIAGLPEVEAVEEARPVRAFNQDGVWVHQSFVGPSPQQTPVFDAGIFGCGQVIAVADTGQDYGACFFHDSVNGPPPVVSCLSAPCPAGSPALNRRKDILYYNWSGTPAGDDDLCPALIGGSGHGTHTSGSAAGDRSPFADCSGHTTPGRSGGDGQAPGAKLVIQEMGDGFEYLNNLGGSIFNLADVAYRTGARIQSFSWGGACHDIFGTCVPGCTIPYDSLARDADLAMWTYPDLMISVAAGNAAQFCPPPVSVGTPANAKSVLTVGSLEHGTAANNPSAFSSPGPVHDGRLKPTVAAQGESVVSAASDADATTNNCATCSLDGTSMAAPTSAGLAALIREYYTAGFYASGARDPNLGFTPSGALLKATLMDGAVALGAAAPGPDFDSGYGRILLSSTLALPGGSFSLRVVDHRQGLATGGVVTRAYDVASGTPFRATLAWTDFPAALNADPARVNELMMEVIDPSGTVWFQTIDPGTGAPARTSNPADPHDALNVEERLVFPSPAPGRWVVRVRGVDVPMGPQPFALVVRGALTECPAPEAPAAPSLGTPADHEVLVSWSAAGGAASYNVYRSLGACPGGPWIQVAAGVPGTSFLDTGLSGGVTYSYHVASASDPPGFCESGPSPCAQVVPTGDCFLAPAFAGLSQAASAGEAGCAVDLSWTAASPYCGTDVRYNVYRSTTPGFTPGPANRIARCVAGTSYTDSADLTPMTIYRYVVRAEDASPGHGGPCRGGNEEGNVVEAAAAPAGPPALGTWTDDAGDTGSAQFVTAAPWTVDATGGNVGPGVYAAASSAGVCSDLTSPTLTLAPPGAGPTLTFHTRHDLEYDPFGFFGAEGSLGQVEIATGPGFGNWTRVPFAPDYPALVEFPLNDCPTTQFIDTYFSGTDMTYSPYTASLANWAGGDVRIRFHLSGDYLYPGGSWWVDDVEVTGALVPSACAATPQGPPPIPDGASAPGAPLRVEPAGSDLRLIWDAVSCPAAAVNVYWGALGDFTRFTGGACGLPPTGTAALPVPADSWILVVATDGASTDGSWSRDAAGSEKSYAGASSVCPAVTQHVTNNGCP
jgi:hypothetical protein